MLDRRRAQVKKELRIRPARNITRNEITHRVAPRPAIMQNSAFISGVSLG
jgi:hypothetical protein